MNYTHFSDAALDREEAIQKERLNFHAHADRMEPRERIRQQEVKWNLAEIQREWNRRMTARQDVTKGLNTLQDRWAR